MSWCTLTLSVQDGDRPLHAGDVLEGEVTIQITRAGRCDGLRVELLVRALGKGNTSERALTVVPLFVGEWATGTPLRYPFRLTIPPAPPPMEGELMTVSHVLRAVAEVPWAIDPKEEHPLTLVPSPEWRSRAAAQDPVAAHINGRKVGPMWVPGAIVFVLLVFTCMPVALLILPLALLMFIPSSRNAISAWRTPKVTVTVPRRVHPGQAVPVLIELDRFSAPLKAVSASLICVERVISGSGKHQRTYEQTLYEETLALSPNEKRTRFEGHGVLPDLPMWSFEGGSYSVNWMLLVRLECSAWPDWITAWPLSLDPGEAPRWWRPSRGRGEAPGEPGGRGARPRASASRRRLRRRRPPPRLRLMETRPSSPRSAARSRPRARSTTSAPPCSTRPPRRRSPSPYAPSGSNDPSACTCQRVIATAAPPPARCPTAPPSRCASAMPTPPPLKANPGARR
ncbi:MAG: hypothetical protein IPO67_22735 [Deltaproteobacteria bacterium]|nr:hypothetical protein [Deltaproteobacteria bacterium]